MAVKDYNAYMHHGGNVYYLLTIAQPITMMPQDIDFGRAEALHTELEETIEIFNFGDVVFTEKDEFLVLYQREGKSKVYARPVDMFFEHIEVNGEWIPRFKLINDWEEEE